MPPRDGDAEPHRDSPQLAGAPDVVGLSLAEALAQLRATPCTLAFTAPPRPRGRPGAVRVVSQRYEGGRLKLICAREYYDAPAVKPQEPGEGGEETEDG